MNLFGKIALGIVALIAVVLVLGYVVLRRPDIPYEKLEAKYAVPTSHYIDLPSGIRAHYRDDGDPSKPVLLLVHGFGDSFLSWAQWIDILSKDFRVVTVDVPGHGLTRAPETWVPGGDAQVNFIEEFAAATNLPPFAIAGNSMGGYISWRTTLAYPERVRALILVDAGGFANDKVQKQPAAFKLLGSPAGQWWLKNLETRPLTKASLQASLLNNPLVTDEFITRWVDVQRAPGHRRILMSTLRGGGLSAEQADLASIKVPTLILWGEGDPLLQVSSAHKFAKAIPGAKLITYPKVGHMPQLEAPEQSAADAEAFLKLALVSTEESKAGSKTQAAPSR